MALGTPIPHVTTSKLARLLGSTAYLNLGYRVSSELHLAQFEMPGLT
jgi:hypothetical protein